MKRNHREMYTKDNPLYKNGNEINKWYIIVYREKKSHTSK